MHAIVATFEDGVLKPTEPLHLPPHTEFRVTIEPLPESPLTVGGLAQFFRELPRLGDDADAFLTDVREIRSAFPAEKSKWD